MFTRQVRKQLPQNIERVNERDKTLARLTSAFVFFLLAKPEFYSIWHVDEWLSAPLS
jgi:hypothetical protein